jgi:hypothetical protein
MWCPPRQTEIIEEMTTWPILPILPPMIWSVPYPRRGAEREAPSFVIQMTNGTGSIRQFVSKAARCKARAAFELCGSPAVVGTAGWRSEILPNPAE